MKTRIVLWGTDANDKRVLVALALKTQENKVDIWTFPEEVATETLYNRMMNEWRSGKEVPFPQMFVQIERPLVLSESILPDDIKVERPDLIQRAQTEWHFVVLSGKLYETYASELEHLRDKVSDLTAFDEATWEELKGFWGKVQSQIHDKNLFRDHAGKLRDQTNDLFGKLKELRRQLDDEFKTRSKANAKALMEKLANIEERIEGGLGLQPLFEELKKLQNQYKDTPLTKDDRSKIWNRLDKAFKDIKERKYGPGYKKDYSALERLQRRYNGLMAAIDKMEKSIGRDKRDQEFQSRRIEESEGQLEAQIRQAKLNMINDRVTSKEAKLNDMLKTKAELDGRMEVERRKEEERKQQEEVKRKEQEIKDKIADDIKAAAEKREEQSEDLHKAAEELKGKPTAEQSEPASEPEVKQEASAESVLGAAGAALSESIQDMTDTVKAVAEVVADKIAEAVSSATDEEE